jgi:hypothetical protein
VVPQLVVQWVNMFPRWVLECRYQADVGRQASRVVIPAYRQWFEVVDFPVVIRQMPCGDLAGFCLNILPIYTLRMHPLHKPFKPAIASSVYESR